MTKSIASLLALAVTTSIALANGGEGEKEKKGTNPYQSGQVAWKPGAGITLADSEDFGLKMTNQLQVQWTFQANDGSPDVNNFTVRRARTGFSGHVFNKDIQFKLMVDAVDVGASIKDGWVQWNFMKGDSGTIGLRTGQSKTYHGLESTGSSSGLFFVERSTATRVFSDSRSRGAWVHGAHSENKIRWNAGFQNGDVAAGAAGSLAEAGEEANNSASDSELNFIANVSFDPMGDMMSGKSNESYKQGDLDRDSAETRGTIGAGLQVGNNRDTGGTTDVESTSININTGWAFGDGLTAQGEIFLRTDDATGGGEEDTTGWYLQGMYALERSPDAAIQWGVGVRLNMIDTDTTSSILTIPGLAAPGDVTELSLVADAFYHGHAAKTQFEYTWQDANPDGGTSSTNHILRVQFQLLF